MDTFAQSSNGGCFRQPFFAQKTGLSAGFLLRPKFTVFEKRRRPGATLVWIRNPPISIKFSFRKPSVACFEIGPGGNDVTRIFECDDDILRS